MPALVVAATLPAAAQTSHHAFSDLGRYLETGDSLHVVTKAEGQVSGELEELTPALIRLRQNDGRTREIVAGDIGWIDRVPDPWWDGALGGAVAGYAFTFGVAALYCAGGDGGCSDRTFTDPGMHRTALKVAGLWGAMFALADLSRRDRWLVYGVRPGAARDQLRERPRAASLEDLWSTVRPDDSIAVQRADGETVTGRFQSASAASVRLVNASRNIEIPASQVRRVSRRTSRMREGMVIGPAVGAAIGGLRPPQGFRRGEGVVTGILGGWAFGTAIGMVLPRRATVFDARPGPAVAFNPELMRNGFGFATAVRF